MKIEKTTYNVEGCKEPCYEVLSDDGYVLVRIAPCYHLVGKDTLILREYLGNDFNGEEEISGDFDILGDIDAKELAKRFCIYLN